MLDIWENLVIWNKGVLGYYLIWKKMSIYSLKLNAKWTKSIKKKSVFFFLPGWFLISLHLFDLVRFNDPLILLWQRDEENDWEGQKFYPRWLKWNKRFYLESKSVPPSFFTPKISLPVEHYRSGQSNLLYNHVCSCYLGILIYYMFRKTC